jgi:hypothetical protein
MHVRFLLRSGADLNASLAAIKGNVGGVIHDDCSVHVNIGDIDGVHVHHGCVVEKRSAAPLAAAKAGAEIAKTIIDAAIEAHCRPP